MALSAKVSTQSAPFTNLPRFPVDRDSVAPWRHATPAVPAGITARIGGALRWWLLVLTFAIAASIVGTPPVRAESVQPATARSATANTNGLALPVVVERDSVVVRAEAGLESLANHAADLVEPRLLAIRQDLEGLPVPTTVELRLIKNAPDMSAAAPTGAGAPPWAAGVAYPKVGVVVVATRRDENPIDVDSTIAHELAHLALGSALVRAPRWLHEGFAYLHSNEAFSLARTQTLTGMVWFGNVIPLEELEQRFPSHESAVDRAYAQAYDFVAFLARRGRYPDPADDGDRWTFRRFLADVATDGDVHRAAKANYGVSLDELFVEWHRDLRDRYIMMPAGLFAILIWVFGALLLILGYLRRRGQNKRRLRQWALDEEGPPPSPLVSLRTHFAGPTEAPASPRAVIDLGTNAYRDEASEPDRAHDDEDDENDHNDENEDNDSDEDDNAGVPPGVSIH